MEKGKGEGCRKRTIPFFPFPVTSRASLRILQEISQLLAPKSFLKQQAMETCPRKTDSCGDPGPY